MSFLISHVVNFRRIGLIVYPVVLLMMLCLSIDVYAHPHMFFTTQVSYVFDDEGLKSLSVTWDMDAYTSVLMLDSYDLDQDGMLNEEELQTLESDEAVRIKNDGYYTRIKINGETIPTPAISDFTVAAPANETIRYAFTIPLEIKADSRPTEVALAQFDETYFTDYILAARPMKVRGGKSLEIMTSVRKDRSVVFYFDQFNPEETVVAFMTELMPSVSRDTDMVTEKDYGDVDSHDLSDVDKTDTLGEEISTLEMPEEGQEVLSESIETEVEPVAAAEEPGQADADGIAIADQTQQGVDDQDVGAMTEVAEVAEDESVEAGTVPSINQEEIAEEDETTDNGTQSAEVSNEIGEPSNTREEHVEATLEEHQREALDTSEEEGQGPPVMDNSESGESRHMESVASNQISSEDSDDMAARPRASFFRRINRQQEAIQSQISRLMQDGGEGGAMAPVLLLLLLSFAYGVVHVIGPGHGKGLTISYVIADGKRLNNALLLGILIPVLHSLSGMVIVFGLSYVLQRSVLFAMDNVIRGTQLVSYGLMILLGGWILISSQREWRQGKEETSGETQRYNVWVAALIVGVVPCPGVVFLLLFGMAFDALLLGVLMATAMMLGMVTGLTALTLIAYLSRHYATNRLSSNGLWAARMEVGLELFGGLMILTYASVFFLAALV